MGYEVDFLAVGEKSSGDAICVRWGNLHGTREEQKVIVIDAGYSGTGQEVVDYLEKYYKTKKIDLLVSTHPDADHVGGLATILENADVKEFWIHQPWEHNKNLAAEFADGRITDASIAERMKENLQKAYDAVKIAKRKNIEIHEPFQGKTWDSGNLTVVGPTLQYYETLIPDFARMPARAEKIASFESFSSNFDSLLEKAKRMISHIAEWFKDENLDDNDTTSAQNNSSVIMKLEVENKILLFTGDAGITALDYALPYIDTTRLKFLQVPHHGSRRNIGPEILNKLVGGIVNEGETSGITAFISCAPGSTKHPHQAVINALNRRGARVVTTEGKHKHHYLDAPTRENWITADPRVYLKEYQTEES